ncbi:hypothetical protein RB623_23810 [Mesorhizobium sp. LHD-90]|uniref:hypothetical protein n=1 Tax=Mesorhizobium sp. LHD-90 TaxID=3071414 RepID=UPI0027E21337|nr:hypothetical protein [Mesorhizobium sp. LHD-90]MDQ6437090.1 hypothetical protein [Mesorhizobium sp. LHD-90]
MEVSPAIDKNWQALKRLLAMLVGMAELGDGITLPRHLHRAILRLLRPAESAARRLIIAAARGIVVTLPPVRPRKPKPKSVEPVLRSLGIAVTMSNADFARAEAAKRAAARRAARPRTMNLPLLDPLKNPFRIRRRYVPAHAVPRIRSLDDSASCRPLPAPPSPDDPVSASRLALRLEALGRALDDLPGQAKRFARWKARHDAARARDRQARAAAGTQNQQRREAVRFRRISPLRRGRPPGGRLSRYDPTATHPRNIREIDEILAHAHALAVYALESPDTS